MDCSFPVEVTHPVFGRMTLVARNLSAGGLFIETIEPLPLGTVLMVHFGEPEHQVIARAEVRNHYFLNYADHSGPRALAGMGLRFLGFEPGGACVRDVLH